MVQITYEMNTCENAGAYRQESNALSELILAHYALAALRRILANAYLSNSQLFFLIHIPVLAASTAFYLSLARL